MPRLFEYDIAVQTSFQVVVPDDMSDELIMRLVLTKAYDLLVKEKAIIQLTEGPKNLTVEEARNHDAMRVSDSWRRITTESVRWLGEEI